LRKVRTALLKTGVGLFVRLGLMVTLSSVAVLALMAPGAQARLEVRVLAHVPAPGFPASTVVAPDGTIYTGSFKSFTVPSAAGPSKVFAYSPSGQLLRSYTVQGQTPGVADAVQVATMDRTGTLYLLDQSPARIIKLDPRTGAQTTWATFATLPACPTVPPQPCSDGSGGNPPEPDFAAWGPDGSLYVTDYNQALIWRVPPGGGPAKVWLTDSRFNGIIVGPAGIQLMPGGHALMVSTGGGGTDPSTGKLYTVPIEPDGQPGQLKQIWESAPAEAPDGFALARSGNIYLSLVGPSGNAVVELSPLGSEIARVPQNAAANEMLAVPFDAPGSVSFDGDNVIVTNESSLNNNSADWALLEISAGEPGLPPSLPPASSPRITYRLRVSPHRVRAGRRTTFHFSAVRMVGGVAHPLAGGLVRFGRTSKHTGKRGRAKITRVLRRRHRRYRATLLVAGHRVATATVSTR
jgi:sugar lactone lactonase YvrE